jgi:hypothetical protein
VQKGLPRPLWEGVRSLALHDRARTWSNTGGRGWLLHCAQVSEDCAHEMICVRRLLLTNPSAATAVSAHAG